MIACMGYLLLTVSGLPSRGDWMTKCAVCGRIIGGNDSVSVVRHVELVDGRAGWIAMHVRCAGKPIPTAAQRARQLPPGAPLRLPMLEGEYNGA